MVDASFDGAALQWSSVVLALCALSPAPLLLPSGVALAVIGLMGAASLLYQSRRPRTAALSCG
jgi:membrane associated rhomboid family serine protease